MQKFCRCGGGFDPGFGEADNIRMVRIYETRESVRMERMLKVQTLKLVWPGFNSMSPERSKKAVDVITDVVSNAALPDINMHSLKM